MNKISLGVFFFLFLLFCQSCRRCSCPVETINIALIGYDTNELANMILKKFEINSSLQTMLTSDTFGANYHFEYSSDTAYQSYCTISYGYDWALELPLATASYTFTDLQKDKIKDPFCGGWIVGERFCNHTVVSLALNGQQIDVPDNWSRNQTFYIHK